MSPESPPLLVAPLESLSAEDRDKFNAEVLDIGKAQDGVVISIPFPIALYHRIDGIWIPVSDLGSFNATHPSPTPPAPDPQVACEDADED
jgi:hypothetical protein